MKKKKKNHNYRIKGEEKMKKLLSDPALVGDSWKSRFIERLSENTNLSELWMSHHL